MHVERRYVSCVHVWVGVCVCVWRGVEVNKSGWLREGGLAG